MCLIAYFLCVFWAAEYRCIDQRHKVWKPINGNIWTARCVCVCFDSVLVYHCSSFCTLIITRTFNAPAMNCKTIGNSPHDTCLQPHSASPMSEKWYSFRFVLFQRKKCTRRQHELPLSAFKPIWMWYGRTSTHIKWKHEEEKMLCRSRRRLKSTTRELIESIERSWYSTAKERWIELELCSAQTMSHRFVCNFCVAGAKKLTTCRSQTE